MGDHPGCAFCSAPAGRASPGAASHLAGHLAEQARRAGHRDAGLAALALAALGDSCSPVHREIAEARIADPDAPWSEIAAELGLTKDAAHNRFRRMLRLKAVRAQLGEDEDHG